MNVKYPVTTLNGQILLSAGAVLDNAARDLVPNYREKVSEIAHGPTHDFGKICIPLEILKKDIALTREEGDYLKHHALAGNVFLAYYLRDPHGIAARVARDHHERMNGRGYPRGVLQKDPMVEIVAVRDVYDAMISPRPYRPVSYDNRGGLGSPDRHGGAGGSGVAGGPVPHRPEPALETRLQDRGAVAFKADNGTAGKFVWKTIRNRYGAELK